MINHTAEPPQARAAGRYFYMIAAMVVIAVVVAGFARTYYLRPLFMGGRGLTLLVHAHGVAMSLWFILFFVQSWLVARGRIKIHRRLGWFAAVAGVAVISLGTVVAVTAAAAGRGPRGQPPLVFLAVPLIDLFVFAVLAGLAIFWRRRGEIHKRLMLLANVGLLPAAVARIPFPVQGPLVFFGLTDVILLTCIAWDTHARGRLHPAFAWGGLFVVLSGPGRLALAETEIWLRFAGWLVR